MGHSTEASDVRSIFSDEWPRRALALGKVASHVVINFRQWCREFTMPQTSGARHRVVIIGSGFGGVLLPPKSLGRASDAIEVTLIDRTNYHLFQPLLYQVATGNPLRRRDRTRDA